MMLQANILQNAIIQEILNYLGLPLYDWRRKLAAQLLKLPAARFARTASEFDGQVGETGFCSASRWLLPQFINVFRATGTDQIPKDGSLIIAANHPGTFDTFMIAACLPREDIKVIARDMPLLRLLNSTGRYLIYSTRDVHVKMTAARASVRHLRAGGALLVYPTGTLDPDPACMPGADQAIESWSASLGLLLRSVPEVRLQTVISSGLLDAKYLRHPLARMQKDALWSQIVAEILQMAHQLGFQKKHKLVPEITFGEAYRVDELNSTSSDTLLSSAIEAGRRNLIHHQQTCQIVRTS